MKVKKKWPGVALNVCNKIDAGLIEALVDSAADREESVRESIFKSIVDIGRKKHAEVLDVMHNYLSKHSKVGVAAEVVH